MVVVPLAAESLGVRSFATIIVVGDTVLLIDPGAGVKQRKPRFPPHPVEYAALQSAARRIDEAARTADAVVVTHYHRDHYVPLEEDYYGTWSTPKRSRGVYADAHVYAKDYQENINQHQKGRAKDLRRVFDGVAAGLTWADGKPGEVGPLSLRFSPAVPHGREGSDFGWVIMVAIEGPDETVVYTSDVQGPVEADTVAWILAQEPDLVLVDGPPLYLPTHKFSELDRAAAAENLHQLAEASDLVIDHHSNRSWAARDFLKPIEAAATDAGHTVDSVASYRGENHQWLEAFREKISDCNPIDPSFDDHLKAGEFADDPIDWADWTF